MAELEDYKVPMTFEREVKRLLEDTDERMLRGDAKNYVAYAVLVARHKVLQDLTNFINEKKTEGDDLDD